MNVVVLGTKQALNRMAGLASAVNVEMVTMADMPKALDSLGKTKFDVVVLGGLNGSTETVYRQVKQVCPAPVVLMFDRRHTDWNKVNLLDISGYIAEQVG